MNYRASIYTLALLGALALAAVSGGLLTSSDNVVYAADPGFDNNTNSRTVPENTPPGVNIGDPISATDDDEDDLEFGNTLTYKLGGDDAASFDIDASTGQLITKAPLDRETKANYSVTVTADDGETRDPPITQGVGIEVTDVTERPAAPFPPTVVSGGDDDPSNDPEESTTSLKVVWHPPENMGDDIDGYEVQYKKSTNPAFIDFSHSGMGTTATISNLDPDTSYQVRVRATSGESQVSGNEVAPWSFVGTGSTNKEGNSPPQSNEETAPATRTVAENTPSGENVGSPVTATDGDTTTLTYSLEGPDADLFNFNTRSGQIRTKAPLNHEDARCGYDARDEGTNTATSCIYRVTVTVVDGAGGSDATGVNIQVGDRTEAPSAPARPTVRATEKSSTSLDVSWNAPANSGPSITGYDVQYRKGSDPFSDDNCGETDDDNCVDITGTSVTIVGLDGNTSYEVRVKANNGERPSGWSVTGTGRTNKANHQPRFRDRPGAGAESARGSDLTVWRTIDENPQSGHTVGGVFADDQDNDRLTYSLQASEDNDGARAEAGEVHHRRDDRTDTDEGGSDLQL